MKPTIRMMNTAGPSVLAAKLRLAPQLSQLHADHAEVGLGVCQDDGGAPVGQRAGDDRPALGLDDGLAQLTQLQIDGSLGQRRDDGAEQGRLGSSGAFLPLGWPGAVHHEGVGDAGEAAQ